MKRIKQPFRWISMFLGVVICAYALYPKGVSYTNLGIWAIFSIGAVILLSAIFIPMLKKHKPKLSRVLKNIVLTSYTVLAIFLSISAIIIYTVPKNSDKAPENAVVVVLGAKVIEDKPSLSLKNRLDAAIEYLNKNSLSMCVVSGGQGSDEKYSEAYVMKEYLLSNGISEDRILVEDKSSNTKENISFSKSLCDKHGIDATFVVATDAYHQYRAMLVCKENGVESYALNSNVVWYVEPIYFVREILALFKYFIL